MVFQFWVSEYFEKPEFFNEMRRRPRKYLDWNISRIKKDIWLLIKFVIFLNIRQCFIVISITLIKFTWKWIYTLCSSDRLILYSYTCMPSFHCHHLTTKTTEETLCWLVAWGVFLSLSLNSLFNANSSLNNHQKRLLSQTTCCVLNPL